MVDDDRIMTKAVTEALQGEDYNTLVAHNGVEALNLLLVLEDADLPDVILLDYDMPWMNGKAFREQLLRDPRLCNIRTIVCTGEDLVQVMEDFMGLGVSVLMKPFGLTDLLELLRP